MKFILLIFFALVAFNTLILGQSSINTDSLFLAGREKAFSGQFQTARKILLEIIKSDSIHQESKILYAKTYAWEHKNDSAIILLRSLAQKSGPSYEALLTISDVFLWIHQPDSAEKYLQTGEKTFGNSEDITFLRAKILFEKENYSEAQKLFLKLSSSTNNEISSGALKYLEFIKIKKHKNASSLEYIYSHNSTPFSPWHWISFEQLRKIKKRHTLVARINGVERFQKTGIQPEIDYYLNFYKKLYSYANLGYSPHIIFPVLKVAGELFYSCSGKYELSLGGRYFDFRTNINMVLTGSVSRFAGNHNFIFRPYFNINMGKIFPTVSFIYKKEIPTIDHTFQLTAVYGFNPDNPLKYDLVSGQYTATNVYNLRNISGRLDYFMRLTRDLTVKLIVWFENEEFTEKRFRNRISIGSGLIFKY